MKAISKLAFLAASLFAAGTVFAQAQPAVPITMLIGNVTANDTQAEVNDKLAELVTKYSNGRIKASARHGGSLGNTSQMFAAMQAGSVHGMITPARVAASVVPELSLFFMPFLFPSEPAKITAAASQSKAAARMIELAKEKGILIIGFHGIGATNFFTKFPVNKVADFKGKKFWVIPGAPGMLGAYQDWGAVGRSMELPELYTALQQGNVDGVANPVDVTYRMKMHEVAKYLTIANPFVLVSGVHISKKWFDGLPKDLQDAVMRAGKDTITYADSAYTKSQAASLEALKKVISVHDMPQAELQKMKDLARKGVWARTLKDPKVGPMLKQLQQDLAPFNKA